MAKKIARPSRTSLRGGAANDGTEIIDTKKGLYIKMASKPSCRIVLNKFESSLSEITINEIKKVAPTLAKLAEYDKKDRRTH